MPLVPGGVLYIQIIQPDYKIIPGNGQYWDIRLA
jgi:hypothetical protein